MCNASNSPITVVSNADIAYCATCWTGQWQDKAPYATWREHTEEGKVFKDILQRIIFPARFEDTIPPKCKKYACGMKGPREHQPMLSLMGNIPESD